MSCFTIFNIMHYLTHLFDIRTCYKVVSNNSQSWYKYVLMLCRQRGPSSRRLRWRTLISSSSESKWRLRVKRRRRVRDSLHVSVLVCSVFNLWSHDRQTEDADRREKNLEEAHKIVIENDPSLPEPKTVRVSWIHNTLTVELWFEVKHFELHSIHERCHFHYYFYSVR